MKRRARSVDDENDDDDDDSDDIVIDDDEDLQTAVDNLCVFCVSSSDYLKLKSALPGEPAVSVLINMT